MDEACMSLRSDKSKEPTLHTYHRSRLASGTWLGRRSTNFTCESCAGSQQSHSTEANWHLGLARTEDRPPSHVNHERGANNLIPQQQIGIWDLAGQKDRPTSHVDHERGANKLIPQQQIGIWDLAGQEISCLL
ncbi:hypothetical protein R1flu_001185 [Riccia fluitans]|uniref:Uncharacterized protein n=1 Tax=Riccia fluitans TaxID=41844 RepID=A0ABD1Y2M0_9MARC